MKQLSCFFHSSYSLQPPHLTHEVCVSGHVLRYNVSVVDWCGVRVLLSPTFDGHTSLGGHLDVEPRSRIFPSRHVDQISLVTGSNGVLSVIQTFYCRVQSHRGCERQSSIHIVLSPPCRRHSQDAEGRG